ncbi:MAG: DUF72 domain-containing protein [Desulfomonilia bacterium]|nr:DUF72 domain-containing protein [Desulfomonilia bacterium]
MKKDRHALIHIGTSGWHYQHWKGAFYPEKMQNRDLLAFYAEHFSCVEINNSFYQWPDTKTLLSWTRSVPENFLFCLKANRFITHMKKLKDPDQTIPPLLNCAESLGHRLGPILFQLPPSWRVNPSRLEVFLESLPRNYRCAFEFRDASWFTSRIYSVLSDHNAAFCIYDFGGFLSPKKITADFVYVRLHGPGDKYQGSYDARTLSGWAGAFSTWALKGKEIFCFFDNDQSGYAAVNALKLHDMLMKG